MTQQQPKTPTVIQRIAAYEGRFDAANQYGLDWHQESMFAKQQLLDKDYLMNVAQNDVNGLRNAIINVAAIGVSLNPALAHAYLVPRDGKIKLDVSYQGVVAMAIECGAIRYCKAELVYEGDDFQWQGPFTPPIHKAAQIYNEDRIVAGDELRNMVGGYCVAKLGDGDWMVEVMTKSEIMTIKAASKAKKGPWSTYPQQMAKKAIVKRAAKSWPQAGSRARLDRTIQIDNETNKTDFDYIEGESEEVSPFISNEQIEDLRQRVSACKADMASLLAFVGAESPEEILIDHWDKLIALLDKKAAMLKEAADDSA